MNTKKIISLMLALIVVIGLVPMTALAANSRHHEPGEESPFGASWYGRYIYMHEIVAENETKIVIYTDMILECEEAIAFAKTLGNEIPIEVELGGNGISWTNGHPACDAIGTRYYNSSVVTREEVLAGKTIRQEQAEDAAKEALIKSWKERVERYRKSVSTFTDVANGSWYHDTVYAAASVGIIAGSGNGSFEPDKSLTWAQTVAFAVRMAQYNADEPLYGTADQKGVWYQVYVDYALEHGLIFSVPDSPEAPITRKDAMIIFARALDDASPINSIPRGYFSDVTAGAGHDAVYKLAEAGVVNGKTSSSGKVSFGYKDTFLRSEAATIVARMAYLTDRVGISVNNGFKLANDVPDNHPNAEAINTIIANGIMSVDENGNFNPDDALTPVELSTILAHITGRTPERGDIYSEKYDWKKGLGISYYNEMRTGFESMFPSCDFRDDTWYNDFVEFNRYSFPMFRDLHPFDLDEAITMQFFCHQLSSVAQDTNVISNILIQGKSYGRSMYNSKSKKYEDYIQKGVYHILQKGDQKGIALDDDYYTAFYQSISGIEDFDTVKDKIITRGELCQMLYDLDLASFDSMPGVAHGDPNWHSVIGI